MSIFNADSTRAGRHRCAMFKGTFTIDPFPNLAGCGYNKKDAFDDVLDQESGYPRTFKMVPTGLPLRQITVLPKRASAK